MMPSNTIDASSSSAPPPPNPVLTAYEDFRRNTPVVTRSILTVLVLSYLLSWVIDPHFAMANIPQFSVFGFEIYRILTSPLVNTRFFSLLFAFLSFTSQGKRMENSMGSTAFGVLCLTMGVLANVLFLVTNVLLYYVSGGEQAYLFTAAAGIWLILFGIIAMECVQAPRGTQRPLFFCKIPTIYYPLALFAVFGLFGQSFSVANLISMGIGYAYGFGYLDGLKPSAPRISQWEETILADWTRNEGWVTGQAILGSDAWSEANGGSASEGMSLPTMQRGSAQRTSAVSEATGSARAGSVFRSGIREDANNAADHASLLANAGSGHTLGTTSRRPTDPRTARLEALERRGIVGDNAV
jgi:membrane associated rhomboid family serine protease